jgi:hypothetical protein
VRPFDRAPGAVVDVQYVAVGIQQGDAVVEFIERAGQQSPQRGRLHGTEGRALAKGRGVRRFAQKQFQFDPPV